MNIDNSFNSGMMTNHINENRTSAQEALSKIGAMRELSGKDNANLMIADALASQISTLTQGVENSNDAVGMLQIADSAVSNLSENTEKLTELSVKNNNAALNGSQKAMLNQEFTATKDAMKDIVDSTTYNGKSLFNESMNFQVGNSETSIPSLEVSGIEDLSIENQEGIEAFSKGLSDVHSDIGASSQQFEVGIANSLSAISNLTSASAQIEETPMDEKINDFKQNDIKLEASLMVQAHQTDMLQKRVSALLV